MKSIVERYIEWVTSEIQIINTYHDHKEKMAWTATAFYVPAIIILGYAVPAHLSCIAKWVLTGLIWITLIMTIMFVSMQFRMRWVAADIEVGLKRINGKLCHLEEMSPSFDLSLPEIKENEIPSGWPIFVKQELDNCATKRSWVDIPKAIFNALSLYRWEKIDDRYKTEVASYCVIVFATVIALGSVWYPELFKITKEIKRIV